MNALTNPTSSTSTPLPASWVEKLLHEMLLTYGKKFTDQWTATTTDDLVAYWSVQLAGYSGAEIRAGLDAMTAKDWPPTLPEFKRMCRPPIDPLTAYYEAVAGVLARFAGESGTWSHPAIYWAAMPMATELQRETYSHVKARWETALAEQMAKSAWEKIPEPMLSLPAPGKTALSRDEAAKRLRELNATGVAKKSGDNFDHLRWAKRIVERERKGDKSLLAIQLKFAHEALGMQEA